MTPENDHHQRYAKWKAAYIHNCLKNGETPIAGPLEGAPQRENGDEDQEAAAGAGTSHSSFDQPGAPSAGGWNQPVPAPRKPAQPTFSDISSGITIISKKLSFPLAHI
jgi:vacuolar protein sorting-associated protein VTA1